MVTLKGTLAIKLKDRTGKVLLTTKIDGDVEQRWSKRTGKALQIVFKNGKYVHLHCKACGNEWKIKEGSDWSQRFDVNAQTIICKKCGKVYKIG
jgi:NAD-dependent SIR2 family protein deacetylase